eukprot:CAMPEP_0198252388 /NCGR_PEP_ID=MMETSP1447-20131203/2888_1 /TAXON_ID=420782 /ORGANISM="Chaetoceros dichaeta, Strain CCMP1751" /LENGTH=264 /DNA_ID=CAMNT_0043937615 /DNA_START=85 /DNA_END=879 /DNA_ORIENTATION=-
MSSAEFKEKGNVAFAAKNYDEAIECYTKAIRLDDKNHVFYSNRSASYAGKQKWVEAISDAKDCIRLNPSFIKGYYRLATAQIESNDLDAATQTIKQGLNIDNDNLQLAKLMRTIKSKKAAAKSSAAAASAARMSSSSGGGGGRAGDSSLSKELIDLQNQFRGSMRDYNVVTANIGKSQKELKMNEITVSELEKLPKDSDSKMYRGIGKMFMLCSQEEVFEHLETEMKEDEKKITDMTQKKDYLERRMTSQQQNIKELTSSPAAE